MTWETYTASAIGADHIRAGKPNEDAVAAERFEVPGTGDVQVIAVADGHGHTRHFRSDRGSRLAVKAAAAAARAWAGHRHSAANVSAANVTAGSVNDLVTDVVARWRALVAADLEADPIDSALPAGDPPEIPYGTTLLMAVFWADVAVLAQVGDGEMLLILPDGRHLEPVPTDSRLDGTKTTSLCQPDAVGAFRVGLVNLSKTPAFAVFASTDGYGNAQADFNWQQVFSADLVRLGIEHGTQWIGGQLKDWTAVCASSDGSGDDTTVALALNASARLTTPARRKRPKVESTTVSRTLPSRPVPDAEKTLIWPDQVVQAAAQPAARPAAHQAAQPAHAEHTLRVDQPRAAEPAFSPPPPGTIGASTAGGAPFGGRLPASRLWLAAAIAVVVVIAVSVFLLTSGSGKGGRPATIPPTPTGTATPKPHHSIGQSVGGKSAGGKSVGGKSKARPSASPTGGAADIARSAGSSS